MNELTQLTEAYESAKAEFEELRKTEDIKTFETVDRFGEGEGMAALGDNMACMLHLMRNCHLKGKFQVIYIDPPFFAKEKFMSSIKLRSQVLGDSPVLKIGAYDDHRSESLQVYLERLALRLMVMRELLSDTGLIWVHLDRRVTHYARILLDLIFGAGNFVNEIIWTYKSGGASKKTFARKHDNLLVYSKTKNYKFHPLQEKSYNRGFKPYRFKGVEEYQDDIGWDTLVNMKDVWQLDMVGRTSAERSGYATHKPERLIERILMSCSDEGDLCGDFYAGSGTLAAVCSRMNRRWCTCDNNPAAVVCQMDRLKNDEKGFTVISGEPWPEGQVSLSGDMVSGYRADLTDVMCSSEEVLGRYMEEDGPCFICITKRCEADGRRRISGYDILGNRFEQEIE